MIIENGYVLRVKFNGVDVDINPTVLNSLVITQYLDRLLPTLRMTITDTDLNLYNAQAYTSVITIGFAPSMDEVAHEYDFMVTKIEPIGTTTTGAFVVHGVLNAPGLFKPPHTRGWRNVYFPRMLEDIALESGIQRAAVGEELNRRISIIQPQMSNALFLHYIEQYLYGNNGLTGYTIHCSLKEGYSYLNCFSLWSYIAKPVRYTFVLSDVGGRDSYPVYAYELVDNSRLLSLVGTRKQPYSYYSWEEGRYYKYHLEHTDYDFSKLCYYLSVQSDDTESGEVYYAGRLSSLQARAMAAGRYVTRLLNLLNLWVALDGLEVQPGDMISLEVPHALYDSNPTIWKIAGNWLVRRVEHTFTSRMMTRLLLCRPGINTNRVANLVRS